MVALCVGQTSCSSKVYTPDVNVKEVNSKQYIYYQDEPFNGTVYGSDESCYMVVENGAPVKAIALHSNGAIAIETTTTGATLIELSMMRMATPSKNESLKRNIEICVNL